jgi:hypothetical protein
MPKASALIPERLIHEEHEEKAQLTGEPGQVVWEERHNRNIAAAESQETLCVFHRRS